jgi:hypothetical protein
MARTFVEFEEAFIDLSVIKAIEKSSSWDEKDERIAFKIIINNPDRIKIDSFLPTYTFKYATERQRDRLFQELREKLEEQDVEFI